MHMQSARSIASAPWLAQSCRALHSTAGPSAPPTKPLRFPNSPGVSWLQQASSVWVQEVEWGSQDTFQHVNNVVYHRWFENGRFDWFTQLRGSVRTLFGAEADRIAGRFLSTRAVGPILKSAEIKFRFPVSHPDRIHVATRLKPDSLLADRFTLEHMVVSERHQRVAAEGTGTIVAFDYAVTKSKTALPPSIAEAIRALEARG
jgi:acyl-CoA thioester hydrolase